MSRNKSSILHGFWKNLHEKVFWLNNPHFHNSCHIILKVTDLWIVLLAISSPKYVLTYATKHQFYLAYFLIETSWQSCFIFDKKNYFLPQNDGIEKKCIWPYIRPSLSMIWSINFFIGNLKPKVNSNICQETKVLSCMVFGKTFMTKLWVK